MAQSQHTSHSSTFTSILDTFFHCLPSYFSLLQPILTPLKQQNLLSSTQTLPTVTSNFSFLKVLGTEHMEFHSSTNAPKYSRGLGALLITDVSYHLTYCVCRTTVTHLITCFFILLRSLDRRPHRGHL